MNSPIPRRLLPCVALAALLVSGVAGSAPESPQKACLDAYVAGQERKVEGKLMAAREAFEVCARPACPRDIARECAGWLTEARRAVPSLSLQAVDAQKLPVPGARFSLDGKAEAPLSSGPIEVDPGPHQLRFVAPGHDPQQVTVEAVAGKKELRVEVTLARETAAAPPPPATTSAGPPPSVVARRIPVDTWIWFGLGAVAGGTGAYLALTSRQRYDSLESSCRPRCAHDEVDALQRRALGADITLGLGAVLVGIGAYRLLSAPSVPVTLSLSPTQATLHARF